ncbi:MAG: EipA family protein [Hyphomicrobiaceae bacterium]
MRTTILAAKTALAATLVFGLAGAAIAQERLPWEKRAPAESPYAAERDQSRYANRYDQRAPDAYSPGRRYDPPARAEPYSPNYGAPPPQPPRYSTPAPTTRYPRYDRRYEPDRYQPPRQPAYPNDRRDHGGYDEERSTYSQSEIVNAGHSFFGSLSKGLAKAIEYAFRRQGRPTGYILGEDASGAFVAGLRYGEGRFYTKYGGTRKVFWQGPSIGYDFGGEGTRTMVLVYNLDRPGGLFRRFVGVQGSAYVIGGASVQLLANGGVTLAPIRTGVGLRLGANVGYLKYTRRPTWNPF